MECFNNQFYNEVVIDFLKVYHRKETAMKLLLKDIFQLQTVQIIGSVVCITPLPVTSQPKKIRRNLTKVDTKEKKISV